MHACLFASLADRQLPKLKACKDADKKLEEASKIDWTKFPSLGSSGPLVQIKPSIFSGCLVVWVCFSGMV